MDMESTITIKSNQITAVSQKPLGFTIIECVIVLVILTVLAASVYLVWPGRMLNVAAQAALLADDLRYAQLLSMANGGRYRLEQTSATSYQITDSAGALISFPLHNSSITLGTGISFSSPVNTLVVFDSLGVPYSDTNIPGTILNTSLNFILYGDGQSMTVSVSPATGMVVVQ
jgi:prepilin-type N-terminal cleavage/methylation domain-containing protein